MQEKPLETVLRHRRIISSAITLIPGDWMPDGSRMYPDLVRAAGGQVHLDKRCFRKTFQRNEMCQRGLARSIHPDMPLTAPPLIGDKRGIHAARAARPAANQQGEIAFVDTPVPELRMQCTQRTGPFCHQQTSARVAIQTMHEFQVLMGTTHRTQQFDGTEADATATVHSQAGRLDRKSVV